MSELKEYLSKKNISYNNLAEYCSYRILKQKCPELNFSYNEKCFIIYANFTSEIACVFKNKLKIELIRANKTSIEKMIDCHLEILDLINELKINLKNIFINGKEELNFKKNIFHLNKWIINDKLQLCEIILEMPNIEPKEIIKTESAYSPLELSEFFYNYFQYEDKNISDKITYIDSKSREEIFQNLFDLYINPDLRKYKLTGPTSNGKSFTLFYFSRLYQNVIYFNLKTLKNQNKKNNLKMIISELSRLFLSQKDIDSLNSDIKKINTEQNIFKIFLEILEIIFNYKIPRLILIIDQYKNKNFELYPNFMEDIALLMDKHKELKIVLCSSINDNINRDDFLNNLENFKGNPKYNKENQDYLFYYGELINNIYYDKNELSINYLFENRQKYIFLFRSKNKSQKEIFRDISNKIRNKINKFIISELNYKNTSFNYTFNDILIYMKSILNEKFHWSQIIDVLSACPLKYSKIIFDGDFFIVKPIFPFIEYFLNNLINKIESEEYFKNRRYNKYTFENRGIKAECFECSAQQALKSNDFLKLPNKERREINLDEISKMNKISDFNFDPMGEYKKDEVKKNLLNEKDLLIELSDVDIIDEDKQTNKNNNSEYIRNLLNKFNINQDIKEIEDDNYEYISKMVKLHEKSIEDYRYEIIKKYNNYKDNKKEIDLLVKESKKIIHKFKGDENIFLTQSKENGECVNYAILFGEPDNKSFVIFQMMCYGNNAKIPKEDMDKIHIKNKLKNILVNSIAMFNCVIKHWYHYLVCYFNKNDAKNNNVNYYSKDMEILLYNPEENKFYSKKKEEINELELTELADLENDDYKSNKKKFLISDNTNESEITLNSKESTDKLIKDLSFLFEEKNLTLKTIFNFIKGIIGADTIYLEFCSFDNNSLINYPNYNKALIYLTKKEDNCFCIVNTRDKENNEYNSFEYFNLKKKKKCNTINLNSLNLSYYYILAIEFDVIPKKIKVRAPKNEKLNQKKSLILKKNE